MGYVNPESADQFKVFLHLSDMKDLECSPVMVESGAQIWDSLSVPLSMGGNQRTTI